MATARTIFAFLIVWFLSALALILGGILLALWSPLMGFWFAFDSLKEGDNKGATINP